MFKEKNNTWYLYSAETKKLKKLRSLLVKEQKNSPEIKDVLNRVSPIKLIQKEKNNYIKIFLIKKKKQKKLKFKIK